MFMRFFLDSRKEAMCPHMMRKGGCEWGPKCHYRHPYCHARKFAMNVGQKLDLNTGEWKPGARFLRVDPEIQRIQPSPAPAAIAPVPSPHSIDSRFILPKWCTPAAVRFPSETPRPTFPFAPPECQEYLSSLCLEAIPLFAFAPPDAPSGWLPPVATNLLAKLPVDWERLNAEAHHPPAFENMSLNLLQLVAESLVDTAHKTQGDPLSAQRMFVRFFCDRRKFS
jgi:hypothetical protein